MYNLNYPIITISTSRWTHTCALHLCLMVGMLDAWCQRDNHNNNNLKVPCLGFKHRYHDSYQYNAKEYTESPTRTHARLATRTALVLLRRIGTNNLLLLQLNSTFIKNK